MASVLSTAMSRLNVFLDSEMDLLWLRGLGLGTKLYSR